MLRYYPDYLRTLNRMVAASRLPLHERGPKLMEIENDIRHHGNPVSKMLVPATAKAELADRRVQIYLRAMVVTLACERYRLKRDDKRWPNTLDELLKAKLLRAIPNDPIDNQPLRYRQTANGIVVYSIDVDGVDNQGNIRRDQPHATGVDLGFRLWNPDQRRLAPLPPVGLPAGN